MTNEPSEEAVAEPYPSVLSATTTAPGTDCACSEWTRETEGDAAAEAKEEVSINRVNMIQMERIIQDHGLIL
jgi:CRISPR/Cas system CSM-associated protein Csm3 (group 7 of RAMP superfamily)